VREPGLVSVVAPMHDEEDVVGAFHARTVAALDGLDYELVLVDDGSRDGTGERLRALAAGDERTKVVTLSRNFGHQAAISAGLEHARGDVVVMLDADLQDPPEVIPEMLAAWRRGADVVYAVRATREGETRLKLASARWFYRLFSKLARIDLAHDSGDFRLMDRAPLDALLSMPERNRFLRGMTVWVGFTQTAVTYRREARAGGRTKFTPARMLRFAFDAITSFSHAPLQAATLLGFAFSILAFLAIPLTVVARYADIYDRGIPTTIVIILLLGGIQLITVGIIGEYVGRIYDEVKRRPLYVVRDRANVEAPTEDEGRAPSAGAR
jgi:polyisoprenyl-phosphate glycosyltransferase